MLIGAGLLVGSWRRLSSVDPGFTRDGVLIATTSIRNARLADSLRPAAFRGILGRVRAIPGVASASMSVRTPIGPSSWSTTLQIDGAQQSEGAPRVELNEISSDYFRTLGIARVGGRDFDRRDIPTSQRVAIVSERVASEIFGGAPIGRRFRVTLGGEPSPPIEIVGVVGSTKQSSLREPPQPVVYLSQSQNTQPGVSAVLAIRASGPVATLTASVTNAVRELDPRYSLAFTTLDAQLDRSLRLERTLGILSGFVGVLALVLAAVGLYGILAYRVVRRRREIGVRIALGATPARVIHMVLSDTATLVGLGVAVGTILALASTRAIASFLYGLTPTDPTTIIGSALVLMAVGAGAAFAPAWRASRVDPVAALRSSS
jgi:predicted permease